MEPKTDALLSLAKGGRPPRHLEVPNFAAIAWSLWLASRAYASLGQQANLPMLNVIVYLFQSMLKIMTVKGVTDQKYLNSDSEAFVGFLWARLNFIGLDRALYEACPLQPPQEEVGLVAEGDQYVVYCIVRTLMQMQDHDLKDRPADHFTVDGFGRGPFHEANAGGGIKKALYMLDGSSDRLLYSTSKMKNIWKRYKNISHLLYACEAVGVRISALSLVRFEKMDDKFSVLLGEILATCSKVSKRLVSLDPVGSSKTIRVFQTHPFIPNMSWFFSNPTCRALIKGSSASIYSEFTQTESDYYKKYKSAEQ